MIVNQVYYTCCLVFLLLSTSQATGQADLRTAKFQNGYQDFSAYVSDHLMTTKRAKRKKFSGAMEVKFRINDKGKVDSVVVLGEDPYLLINPIKAMFYSMPKWEPAKKGRRPIASFMTETLTFSSEMPVYGKDKPAKPKEKTTEVKENPPTKTQLTVETYEKMLLTSLHEKLQTNRKIVPQKVAVSYVAKLYFYPNQQNIYLDLISGVSAEVDGLVKSAIEAFYPMAISGATNSSPYEKLLTIDFSGKKPNIMFGAVE